MGCSKEFFWDRSLSRSAIHECDFDYAEMLPFQSIIKDIDPLLPGMRFRRSCSQRFPNMSV